VKIMENLTRKIVLVAAGGLLAAACSPQEESAETAAAPPAPPVSGIDLDNIDNQFRPQDDFYRYVNGGWLDRTEIPADRSNYGSFSELFDESERASREIIEQAAAAADAGMGSNAQKVGDFYSAFMDEAAVEADGMDPVRPYLAAIDEIADHTGVVRYMGEAQRSNMAVPIGFFVNNDSKEPTRYAVYLTQFGLGLPNRDYYDQEQFAEKKAAYEAYITDMLGMSGFDGGAERAAEVVALETRLAAVQWTPVENRDRNATYNLYTLDELADVGEGFDWMLFLDSAGVADRIEDVIIRQPTYAEALGGIVTDTPVEVWQDYFRFHLMNAASPFLSSEFVDRAFAFNGTTLNGTAENRPRWKRAVGMVTNVLGDAVGQLYVEQYFPSEAKVRMDELVSNLVEAFDQGIDGLVWMSAETQAQAEDKLLKFTRKIGYPDQWQDYATLEVGPDSLFQNMVAATAFGYEDQISRLGGPIRRWEWFMTPMTVNAYYNPPMNEIVFPAAILQPPFFNMAADDAVNYGGIGAVIGHEISHGFDDQGRKSDGDGVLRDWWTEADAEAFQARTEVLGAQYDGYCPFEDACVQGAFTMGENIGDLSGLSVAYSAYRLSLNGEEAPVIDGLTGDQRFFMGWAQVWRRLYREDNLRMRLSVDPHSPSEFRTNGIVRNIDAWYQAFDVQESDALYLPPEERVKIW
jgi:putative endopeptidase